MGLPRVSRVFFESKSKNGNLLIGHGVEQSFYNAMQEALLLIFVDHYDLAPVLGNLRQL